MGNEKKTGGSRLKKEKKKGVWVVPVLLAALAVVAFVGWKTLFVRPELGGIKGPGSIFSGGKTEKTEEEIDYGEGVRPRAEGARKSEDYYTVLILGRDTGGGGNTDTMLLASYDVTNQKATVMSIPRDTMVNVSWDVKKINSVYNQYGGGEKGVKALYKEISQLIGFEPDYQVVVEWEAVGKIVDAIGGVYFDVPYPMDYHDPYQDLVIEQSPGYRLLTGEDAMQVIRWRGNDNDSPYGYTKKKGGIGDSGRMEVQQSFLKAMLKQMLTIQNMGNIGKISKVFQESVETDMSFQNVLWFAQKAILGGLTVENVEFLTMPYRGASVYSRSYTKQLGRYTELSYVVPNAKQLLTIVNEKLSPFVEEFTLSDLDIMSVNADGSIRSSSGRVEDQQAAVAPVKPSDAPPVTEEDLGEGETIVVDPETGGPAAPPQDPVEGEAPESGETPPPAGPAGPPVSEGEPPVTEQTPPPEATAPEPPAENEPVSEGGFAIIEQPPAE